MAKISKIILPNHDEYDLTIAGTLPLNKGGTGATTAAAARDSLGLKSAATHYSANNVSNDDTLPTGAAVKNYVEKHIVVSSTQPTGQIAGDIWMITKSINSSS